MLAIREGFPIAHARYNWEAGSDTLRARRARLKTERHALKIVMREAKRDGLFGLQPPNSR